MPNDKVLFEEAKAAYARQLADSNKLDQEYQKFLRIGVLVLSIVLIALRVNGIDSTSMFVNISSVLLLGAVSAIFASIVMCFPSIGYMTYIKKINAKLNDDSDLKNNDIDIIPILIEKYNTARMGIASKYGRRIRYFMQPVFFLFIAVFFIFSSSISILYN